MVKIHQYAEEKARRLSLRTDTDPMVVWIRNRVRQYVRDRNRKIEQEWDEAGGERLLLALLDLERKSSGR